MVFTERIETLNWLAANLRQDLRLRENQLETLHGGMSDLEQQRVVEDFGNAARPVRLLVCSDVAPEGINLHYHCHRLIHFDMPWSLMVFAQRNGRVDRYGQERTPQIVYLTTRSGNDVIRGDMRVLEVLKAKDEQAYRNIGDPSAFMNVHDIEEEEEVTTRNIAAGVDADAFDAALTPTENAGDSLLALFTSGSAPAPEVAEPSPPPSLYADDLAYCEAALHRLREKDSNLHFETDATAKTLTLDAPEDLRHRFAQQPSEAMPEHGRFVLTTARNRMADAIAESRRDEHAWPRPSGALTPSSVAAAPRRTSRHSAARPPPIQHVLDLRLGERRHGRVQDVRYERRVPAPRQGLICIGTSATVGDESNSAELRQYAADVFGQAFDDNAILREERQSIDELLGTAIIQTTSRTSRT